MVQASINFLLMMPQKGDLIIAEPFLKDPSFMRSVVLICRHSEEEGTFGFTLHKPFPYKLSELLTDVGPLEFPVFEGGPVSMDTLHFVHNYPELFSDCEKICEGVYWGGSYQTLQNLLKEQRIDHDHIRFFLGYSGWSSGQLANEMKANAWLVTPANKNIIFTDEIKDAWKMGITQLGSKYKMMLNFPTDPQLN